MDITATSSEDTTAEVSKLNKEQVEQKDKQNDKRKFVLPPEYDENDSRWTLKYRELAPGVVELMEHSGVYVNADKLAECKRLSNDCLTFAGRLLTEIFTTSALSTCSLSPCSVIDATASDLDKDGTNTRPKLDVHAMIILLKFVAEYGLEKDWNITNYQIIQNSIRLNMEVMRYVRRNVEDVGEHLKDKLCQKRKGPFVEYDENYSRWTLKYREPAPGLVELMEHSGVYVNAGILAECKRRSNDSTTLVRMLLTEVFALNALCSCSLSVGTDNGYDTEQDRPELDTHAIQTLLNFVAEFGLKMDWLVMEYQYILKSIRQKMELMRRIGRKEEDEADDVHLKRLPKALSEWTLKYRRPAPKLVELMEHSGVYVDADKLAECKRLATDCVTLAEMLLTEVYSMNGLSSCSLSEKNRRIYETLPASAHPNVRKYCSELDAYAEIILLNFVDEYGLEKGWPIIDFQIIRRSMINKNHEMRREPWPRCPVYRIKMALWRAHLRFDWVRYSYKCKNVLPSEYDKNDSRWTLKYRDPAPGAVELVEHSTVYVNADKLAECKRLSNDRATLAQKLLTEIFTTSALSTCSWTDHRVLGGNFIPGLNKRATQILLKFVVEFKEMQNCTIQDEDSIAESIWHVMMMMKKRT